MTKDQLGAILEDLDGKLDAVVESLSFMATKEEFRIMMERMQQDESRINFMERLAADHDKWLHEHNVLFADHTLRIAKLETA